MKHSTSVSTTNFQSFEELSSEPLLEWGFSNKPELVSKGSTIFITNLVLAKSQQTRLGILNGGSMSLIDVEFVYDNAQIENLFFLDDNLGWLLSTEGSLFKTTNGGYNWTLIHSDTGSEGDVGDRVFFVDANTGYSTKPLTGINQAKLVMTTNGGITWSGVEETIRFDGLRNVVFLGQAWASVQGRLPILKRGIPCIFIVTVSEVIKNFL